MSGTLAMLSGCQGSHSTQFRWSLSAQRKNAQPSQANGTCLVASAECFFFFDCLELLWSEASDGGMQKVCLHEHICATCSW